MADLFQMTGALKNPSSAVPFPSQPIIFFFFPPKSGTSGLGLATLQGELALCTALVFSAF